MKEVISLPFTNEWRQAMEEELHGLWGENSIKYDEPLSNMKPIKIHFVFKLKQGADGRIKRYRDISWQTVSLNAPEVIFSKHSAQ